MVKLKSVKNKKVHLHKKNQKPKQNSEFNSFLKEIKTNINKKKSSKNNLYSLFSCIFLCFHENKKKILDKKEICDFVKKEITENNNKIITYSLKLTKPKKSEFEIVTTRNYYPKLNHILNNSKCITKIVDMETNKEEQYELNEEYIIERKIKIINHLFKPRSFPRISLSPLKRKHMKFEFCLSSVNKKGKKYKKEKGNDKKKDIKDKDIINDKAKEKSENYEEDSSIISSKDTDINEKNEKGEEKDNNYTKKDIFENNKLEGKKIDKKNDKKNALLNQKRKNPFKIDNCLRMPTFVEKIDKDDEDNKNKSNKNDQNINNDMNDKKKDELISNSLNAKNAIIDQGQQFIILLKNKKFINMLKNDGNNNNNIRVNEHFLLNYQNTSISNFLTIANNEYAKFSELIVNILKNKEDIFDLNDIDELFSDKILNKSEKFQIKKYRCSLLINRIITELSHFLLEYDFVVNVIKEIYENDKNSQALKDIINFIDKNKNILSKENITYFEQLLRTELNKTEIFYIINYDII